MFATRSEVVGARGVEDEAPRAPPALQGDASVDQHGEKEVEKQEEKAEESHADPEEEEQEEPEDIMPRLQEGKSGCLRLLHRVNRFLFHSLNFCQQQNVISPVNASPIRIITRSVSPESRGNWRPKRIPRRIVLKNVRLDILMTLFSPPLAYFSSLFGGAN